MSDIKYDRSGHYMDESFKQQDESVKEPPMQTEDDAEPAALTDSTADAAADTAAKDDGDKDESKSNFRSGRSRRSS